MTKFQKKWYGCKNRFIFLESIGESKHKSKRLDESVSIGSVLRIWNNQFSSRTSFRFIVINSPQSVRRK